MNDYIKQEIIGQNRHLFVYGYKSEERTNFIKTLANENKIVIDENKPLAIYLNDYGLPLIERNNLELDTTKIKVISQEYFNFSLFYEILLQCKENIPEEILNRRLTSIFRLVNRYNKGLEEEKAHTIDDLIKIFSESKHFWKSYYELYLKEGKDKSLEEPTLPFCDLDLYITHLKKDLNNNSCFAIIIDYQKQVALDSIMVINDYIFSINKDFSLKIVTDPQDYPIYKTSNSEFIEPVHDYGTIELDDSLKLQTAKLKRKYFKD